MVKCGRSFGTVACDPVVGAGGGVHRLHRAHGKNQRIVAGRRDGSVSVNSGNIQPAIIARRHHDQDPIAPGRFHGLTERITDVAGGDAAPQGQVDDPDVVSAFQSDGALNGRNHHAVGPASVLIEDLEVDQVDVRRRAAVLTVGLRSVASDDPGDVGAVTVEVPGRSRVIRRRRPGEILVVRDARVPVVSASAEVVTAVVHPAVDDRDANARALVSGLPCRRNPDRIVRLVVHGLQGMVGSDGDDLVILGKVF